MGRRVPRKATRSTSPDERTDTRKNNPNPTRYNGINEDPKIVQSAPTCNSSPWNPLALGHSAGNQGKEGG